MFKKKAKTIATKARYYTIISSILLNIILSAGYIGSPYLGELLPAKPHHARLQQVAMLAGALVDETALRPPVEKALPMPGRKPAAK